MSPIGANDATHDPGAGLRLREGLESNMDLLVVSSFFDDDADSDGTPRPEDDDGDCFRPQDFGTQTTVSGGLFAREDLPRTTALR